MALGTIGQIERQVRDHGYSIKTSVDRAGVAVVTLSASATRLSNEAEFKGDSGADTSASRYHTALAIAVDRMLDFEYRSDWSNRPALGDQRSGY